MSILITLVLLTVLIVKALEYVSNSNLYIMHRELSCFEYECRTYNLTEAAIMVSRDRLKSMELHTDLPGYTKEV